MKNIIVIKSIKIYKLIKEIYSKILDILKFSLSDKHIINSIINYGG